MCCPKPHRFASPFLWRSDSSLQCYRCDLKEAAPSPKGPLTAHQPGLFTWLDACLIGHKKGAFHGVERGGICKWQLPREDRASKPKEGALPEPMCRVAHCGWRGGDWDWWRPGRIRPLSFISSATFLVTSCVTIARLSNPVPQAPEVQGESGQLGPGGGPG